MSNPTTTHTTSSSSNWGTGLSRGWTHQHQGVAAERGQDLCAVWARYRHQDLTIVQGLHRSGMWPLDNHMLLLLLQCLQWDLLLLEECAVCCCCCSSNCTRCVLCSGCASQALGNSATAVSTYRASSSIDTSSTTGCILWCG